ncbi:MAG TPA: SMP-30/gluconolactonase/LRE family protein, partial [Tepidisphaeraceae bacterium]
MRTVFPVLAIFLLSNFALGQPATAPAPGAGAEQMYRQIDASLQAIQKDIPHITEVAEAAAKVYLSNDGMKIGADGASALYAEAAGRSGGIMAMGAWWVTDPNLFPKGVMLYGLRDGSFDVQLKTLADYNKRGLHVIAIGRRDLIDRAKQGGAKFVGELENHAAEHGGLFDAGDGKWLVPTDDIADIMVLWTWTGEFVSACTRSGWMPTMWESINVPGGKERDERMQHFKFHEKVPEKVEAGKVAGEYLTIVSDHLKQLHDSEMSKIAQASALAAKAYAAHHGVYAEIDGHAIYYQFGAPHDPGYFERVNDAPNGKAVPFDFQAGDFVMCYGYMTSEKGGFGGGLIEQARKAGATIAWTISTRNADQVEAIPRDEIFIDPKWAGDDCEIQYPGYDIKVLPISGILTDAIVVMMQAEMFAQLPRAAEAKAFEVVKVAEGFKFPEGPAYDGRGELGHIYVSNCDGDTISVVNANGHVRQAYRATESKFGKTNGLTVGPFSALYACDQGKKAILRLVAGEFQVVADACAGQPFQGPNDLAFGLKGDLYFTDPAGSNEKNPIGCVYRVAPDRKVTKVAEGLAFPNGIAFSTNGKTLYV